MPEGDLHISEVPNVVAALRGSSTYHLICSTANKLLAPRVPSLYFTKSNRAGLACIGCSQCGNSAARAASSTT